MKKIKCCVLALSLYIVGFVLFASLWTTVFHNTTRTKAPLISFVDQAITNGCDVYTLDDVCNRICRFSVDGKLRDIIRINSYSASIIFFDKDLRLCRNDYKIDKLFVYDDDGNIIETYDWDWFGSEDCPIPMMNTSNAVSCKYQNRLLFSSTITISDGIYETKFVVEYFSFHLFCCAAVVLVISLFGVLAAVIIKEVGDAGELLKTRKRK